MLPMRDNQQVKIVLLSFWSVNRWVSQFTFNAHLSAAVEPNWKRLEKEWFLEHVSRARVKSNRQTVMQTSATLDSLRLGSEHKVEKNISKVQTDWDSNTQLNTFDILSVYRVCTTDTSTLSLDRHISNTLLKQVELFNFTHVRNEKSETLVGHFVQDQIMP